MSPANFSEYSKSRSADAHARCALEVQAGNADICVGEILETAELRALAPFTSAYAFEDLVLVSSQRGSDKRSLDSLEAVAEIAAPLAWETWAFVGISLVLGAVVMWIVERGVGTGDFPARAPGEGDTADVMGSEEGAGDTSRMMLIRARLRAFCSGCYSVLGLIAAATAQIFTSVWISFVGFFAKSHGHRVSSAAGRTAVVGLSLLSFFITSAYIANRAARRSLSEQPSLSAVASLRDLQSRSSTQRLCAPAYLEAVAVGRLGIPNSRLRLIEAPSALQDVGGGGGGGEKRVGGDSVAEGIALMETMRRGGCAMALMRLRSARAVTRVQVALTCIALAFSMSGKLMKGERAGGRE